MFKSGGSTMSPSYDELDDFQGAVGDHIDDFLAICGCIENKELRKSLSRVSLCIWNSDLQIFDVMGSGDVASITVDAIKRKNGLMYRMNHLGTPKIFISDDVFNEGVEESAYLAFLVVRKGYRRNSDLENIVSQITFTKREIEDDVLNLARSAIQEIPEF